MYTSLLIIFFSVYSVDTLFSVDNCLQIEWQEKYAKINKQVKLYIYIYNLLCLYVVFNSTGITEVEVGMIPTPEL